MNYIQFDPKTLTVAVTDREQRGGANIRVTAADFRENPFSARIPVASHIYEHVLYPAVEAKDRREGRKVAYSLVPPDPWLVAIALVMWEGIVQGVTWDGIKVSVKTALNRLRQSGVAPESEAKEVTDKEARELGFCWTNYLNGKKQYHMFIGLRRVYQRQIKTNPKRKVSLSRKRKLKQ